MLPVDRLLEGFGCFRILIVVIKEFSLFEV